MSDSGKAVEQKIFDTLKKEYLLPKVYDIPNPNKVLVDHLADPNFWMDVRHQLDEQGAGEDYGKVRQLLMTKAIVANRLTESSEFRECGLLSVTP